ncbi:MAG: hypothetical protein JRI68_09675 [Deltaproteobacteria bacterium]|nr:hypothetical protein [Deltaproteobacteria bacterium]
MPKPNPKRLLATAASYLKAHPEEIVRVVRGAVGMRIGVPLDALRHLAEQFGQGKKAPQDMVFEAAPPGLRVEATVRAMGTTMRARLTVFVEELDVGTDQARVTTRIADMSLEVLDGDDTPLAGLIKSGALDLSKPGNLVAYMPKRPDVLVEAEDDRIVFDILKAPKLAQNRRLRRALSALWPVLSVAAVRTRDDHLDVHFKASPTRIGEALSAARSDA